jgi:hypothetical protein
MQNNKLGEQAMKIISDYPLYASTSNITYKEAIAIAKILIPTSGWNDYLNNDGEQA